MVKKILLVFGLLGLFNFWSSAEEVIVNEQVDKIVAVVLEGIENNDLKKIHAISNKELKKELTPQVLDSITELLAESLEMGYEKKLIGSLDKNFYTVYLLKLDFTVKGIPDMLLKLGVKGDECIGIFIE